MVMETLRSIFGRHAGLSPDTGETVMASSKTAFKYGWCHTDHKNGKEIRTDWRSTDYLKDEPYASQVKAMLEQLGVPFPAAGEIFRGTNHDLLFLNSHGVVLRIGPLDVTDLMNPGILQPLGYLEDREHMIGNVPFTVAIYPGIELRRNYNSSMGRRPELAGRLGSFLCETEQGSGDFGEDNNGIIRVLNDEGQEVAVEVVLDADNSFNSSFGKLPKRRADSLQEHEKSSQNKGEVLSRTIQDVFNAASGAKHWLRAFHLHQPLRQLFWEAFDNAKNIGDVPDAVKRDVFWDKCAEVTNRPQPVVMPLWRLEKDATGKVSYIREETVIPNLVLYRQWTKEEADKIIEPIQQPASLKAAVQRAHDALMMGLGVGTAPVVNVGMKMNV